MSRARGPHANEPAVHIRRTVGHHGLAAIARRHHRVRRRRRAAASRGLGPAAPRAEDDHGHRGRHHRAAHQAGPAADLHQRDARRVSRPDAAGHHRHVSLRPARVPGLRLHGRRPDRPARQREHERARPGLLAAEGAAGRAAPRRDARAGPRADGVPAARGAGDQRHRAADSRRAGDAARARPRAPLPRITARDKETRAVHVGLAIKNFVGPTETPDVDALYRYAERAEALGFESLWAWDHVILGVEPSFPILDAVGTLTAIAARTSRIKLGTGVLVLPLRNPTVAAKAIGTLDVVSKGRLILGVAAGWYAREFDAVGVPFRQRGRLFERNFEILTRLWTEDRVTLQADEFNLREAVMRPKTAQRPRPPVLIGGYVDAVLRRVARMGDGWLTYFYTPESYRTAWKKIVGFAREAGRDPATLTGTNQLAIYA